MKLKAVMSDEELQEVGIAGATAEVERLFRLFKLPDPGERRSGASNDHC
jgi:hypothetical protein